MQKKRFFYDEDPDEEEVVETLNPVYFYYANGKVAGVTLVGRRQLQEPAASQDPEFVSHWDGLSEEEKSDVMAVEDLRASLQRKAGAGGADNNSEQQPLGDEAEVPPNPPLSLPLSVAPPPQLAVLHCFGCPLF